VHDTPVLRCNSGLKVLRVVETSAGGRALCCVGRYGRSWIWITSASSEPASGHSGRDIERHAYVTRSSGNGLVGERRCFTVLGGHNWTFERATVSTPGRSGYPAGLELAVIAPKRMNSHESATSDMEKRIELEKRGRAAEEVSGFRWSVWASWHYK